MDMTGGRGKCIKQFARIVKKSVKCHLSQTVTVRFIAKNAIRKEKIAGVNLLRLRKSALII